MNRPETMTLLSIIAVYDHRTIGNADIAAWHAVMDDADFYEARDAVVEHFKNSTDWCNPAHIRERIRLSRSKMAPNVDATEQARIDREARIDAMVAARRRRTPELDATDARSRAAEAPGSPERVALAQLPTPDFSTLHGPQLWAAVVAHGKAVNERANEIRRAQTKEKAA